MNNLTKFRKISAILAVILFIGAVLMPFPDMNYPLVRPLFFGSYVLLLVCELFSFERKFALIFAFMAALIPTIELLHLVGFSFHVREFIYGGNNAGIFSSGGFFGEAVFSLFFPGIVFVINHFFIKQLKIWK